ncbi:2-octaprenyl-6-methoxyphenol hydroxylase [Rhodoligotrophos appendicifer]|uniref:FAD-dependent monooxygenase n=1 Tax=Rhodoligotrophos appendicifer TaxID=987056 RepID=UPI001FE9786C|nr:FAD-dependent monooxygenase [Rhodoligotrophos appendicifer]
MAELRFDTVIIGGGLVGMAAAVSLAGPTARSPLKVALIDARDPASFSTAEQDGRASAVTVTSRRMLEAIGVWSKVTHHAQPIRNIEVTDSALGTRSPAVLLRFDDKEPDSSAWVIENRFLYQALYDAIIASPHITVMAGCSVLDVDLQPNAAKILLADGRQLLTPLTIAADGRNSPVRELAGIKIVGWPYGQYGLVTTVKHEMPHRGVAVERFLPAGPFAILPLPGNMSSLVWTEGERAAKRLLAADDADFLRELKLRFGEQLGRVSLAGPRHGYPLSLQIARSYVVPRLALVGDAAHVLHPIAGLGFNLGLRDVAALSEVVIDSARLGLDIGAIDTLERYQSWRRFDALKVAAMTEGLNRLFSNESGVLKTVRDVGLAAVNQAQPVKAFFMKEAAGRQSDLPRLMSGERL